MKRARQSALSLVGSTYRSIGQWSEVNQRRSSDGLPDRGRHRRDVHGPPRGRRARTGARLQGADDAGGPDGRLLRRARARGRRPRPGAGGAARPGRHDRARDDDHDQRGADRQRRHHGLRDHQGLPRRAQHAPRPEGAAVRQVRAAAPARPAPPDPGRRGADHARRRGHDPAERGRRPRRGERAARGAGRRRRRLLPVVVPQPRARAADRRDPAGGAARRLRLALDRGAAADPRLRAPQHHRAERLRRPGAQALPRAAGGGTGGARVRRDAADHAVQRRRDVARAGPALRLQHAALRPRRRPAGRHPLRRPQRDHGRHGRHVVRRRARQRRRPDGHDRGRDRRPPRRLADPRHPHRRRRRRLDRLDRQRRPARGRPGQRGRRPRARVLRPRRHPADGDRRRPAARLPGPDLLPRRRAAARRRGRAPRGGHAGRPSSASASCRSRAGSTSWSTPTWPPRWAS